MDCCQDHYDHRDTDTGCITDIVIDPALYAGCNRRAGDHKKPQHTIQVFVYLDPIIM